MQDAEKLQLAVKQMQQILDKAHHIVHDPNLPNLLAAYDVTRDCIRRDGVIWNFFLGRSIAFQTRFVIQSIGYRDHARLDSGIPRGAPLLRTRKKFAGWRRPPPHERCVCPACHGCSARPGPDHAGDGQSQDLGEGAQPGCRVPRDRLTWVP